MSSIGYGFAQPCLQILSAFTRRRVAAAILVGAAVVFLINGYRFGKFSIHYADVVGIRMTFYDILYSYICGFI